MINRRGFFGFLGASPFAARSVAANVTKSLGMSSRVKTVDWGDSINQIGDPDMPMVTKKSDPKGFLDYLMNEGFPEWKLEEIREEVKFRHDYFEPSIKSLKSVSLSHKAQMQMNKDIEHRKALVIKRLKESMLPINPAKALQEKFGFWL